MKETVTETTIPAGKKKSRLAFVFCLIGILLLIFDFLLVLPVNIPRFAGYQAFFITTGSMDPVIPTGSIAYFKTVDPAVLQPGDMIAYTGSDGIVVVHRVNKNDTDGKFLLTKGDNNKILDKGRIPYENVRGIYYGFIPGIGKMMYFMHSAIGRMLMIAIAAAGAVLVLLSVIVRFRMRKAGYKAEKNL